MPGQNRLDQALTVVLALCAIVVTGFVTRQEFFPPRAESSATAPTERKDWKQFATGAKRIGRDDARVTIVEFADFQCPFCAQFATELAPIQKRYGPDVALVFRSYPLEQLHPYARPAALAAECAAASGKFADYYNYLYSHQDSLSVLSWGRVAEAVGIRDTLAFVTCTKGPDATAAMKADIQAAGHLGVTGTPTILVNRWLLTGTPPAAVLENLISREMAANSR